MPSAILRESVASRSNVDMEKGIVTGCRLAEVGKMATFAGLDGNATSIKITPALVDSLLALCSEDNRLSAHWTHDWTMGAQDAIVSRVATWRNFRKDCEGNLIADAFTWPGEHRDAILHAAENDPDGMMVSMVFDYTGGENNPIAQSVAAADFVAKGAATTALCSAVLSALNKNKTAKMADPVVDPNAPPAADPAPAAPFTPDQVNVINQMIQAALNPPQMDDASAPAMFAFFDKKIDARIEKRFGESENKVATLAEASFVKKIGGTVALANFSKMGTAEVNPLETAVTAQLALMKTPNRGVAIARALRDNPELEEFRATLK